jgi:hypothetical protein
MADKKPTVRAASEVETPRVDLDEQQRRKAANAVASRMARREALRRNGAVGIGSADLATRLEEGLRKRDQKVVSNARARKAVRDALRKRSSGEGRK